MKLFKNASALLLLVTSYFLLTPPALAAAPDGSGPWADDVLSSSQGLMKDGGAVPAIRSNPSAAVGEAEFTLTDGDFYSLGFGGNIVLGFDNGVSNGAIIIESTFPDYPGELASVAMSEDGTTWVTAGMVTQDGVVTQPEGVTCARYVRITDVSNPEDFGDATADGYDVDGVQATGDPCPTATPTPSVTPTPTPSSNNSSSSSSSSNESCQADDITTVPAILQTNRVSPTSIFVSWGPFAGLNDFTLQYGFENGDWDFSTNVSGFSTTINDLPANQAIWVRVAARNECETGSFGGAVFTGGTTATNPLIPGFPNTGGNPLIPFLPNTGFDPSKNGVLLSWSLTVLMGAVVICLLGMKHPLFSKK